MTLRASALSHPATFNTLDPSETRETTKGGKNKKRKKDFRETERGGLGQKLQFVRSLERSYSMPTSA